MLEKLKVLFKKKSVRFGALGLVAACVAGGAYASLNRSAAVSAFAASYQSVEDSFYEDGMVRAQKRGAVSADVAGKVLEVCVEEGQTVRKGDILLKIDTSDLEAGLEILEAQHDGILAAWAQASEQMSQQIAGLKTQRAGYYSSAQRKSINSQIDMLYASLDPNNPESAAFSYMQMMSLTDERISYAHNQLNRAAHNPSASEDAILNQLNAAQYQVALLENQKLQYVQPGGNDPAVINSFDDMIRLVNNQVSDLSDQLYRAQRQIPETIDALNAQIIGMYAEREQLEDQWNNYNRQVNAQISVLEAQLANEKSIRSTMDEQISMLEKSAGDDSGTSEYYAAQLRQVDANIADLERKLQLATVRAPIDGVVGAMDVVAGRTLMAGMEITEIIDPDSLMIECMLLTGDAGSVNENTPVVVIWERKDGDVSFEGRVERISALAVNSISAVGLNEQRVKVTLEPSFEGKDAHPMDGYQVRVKFLLSSDTALTVPKSAVVKSDMGDAVFVLRDGFAYLTPINTGLESGSIIAVMSGLNANDVVISDPTGLDDGAKVSAK